MRPPFRTPAPRPRSRPRKRPFRFRDALALKNRRGAFAIMFALFFLVLMGVVGIAVDMSRAATMRNELQTAADAAALSGALQLRNGYTASLAETAARAYAAHNKSMGAASTVDSVELGKWNDATSTFTKNATPYNAVNVVVKQQVNYFFAPLLGVTSPTVKARAVGWAGAPVTEDKCLKPWTLPYTFLMYKVNIARNIPNTEANLTRPWEPDADMAALRTMTQDQRTFTLKQGAQCNGPNCVNPLTDPTYDGGEMSGNYYGVQLPRLWDAATGTYPQPGPVAGGNAYRDNVAGVNCHEVAVGDSLLTQTGNLVGPTIQGVEKNGTEEDYVCAAITNDQCINDEGTVGVKIKASFYSCGGGCNGNSRLVVRLLGSFVMTGMTTTGNDKASMSGYFEPVEGTGPVAGGATTLDRLILAR